MAEVRAAILAAGRGVRMGGSEAKTLLPVGRHEPLLFYILAGLRAAGIDNVLVVTGFKPDAVTSYVVEHAQGLEVAFVRNARFATWGNFHTVRIALEQSPHNDVLVVNSDVVVHPDVYARVAATPGDLVLAVEARAKLDDEDMRVHLQDGRVMGIGKDLDMDVSHGEYDGVSLVRPAAAARYCELATDAEWKGHTSIYYEDVYGMLLDRVDGRAAMVGAGEYAEIDRPEDVPGAAAVIARHGGAWDDGEGR